MGKYCTKCKNLVDSNALFCVFCGNSLKIEEIDEQGIDMAKYLVIVESPAKVKTIKKFLGTNYEVLASNGHVRDLPKSSLGIDVENDYEPKYITIRGKGDILAALRKAAKKAEKLNFLIMVLQMPIK